MLLGAAKYLSTHRRIDGTVYPGLSTCRRRWRRRARDDQGWACFDLFPMDAIFGAHNWPGLQGRAICHQIRAGHLRPATNSRSIIPRARGHTAAMPHNGIDPLPVACQIVQGVPDHHFPQQEPDRTHRRESRSP